MTALNTASQPSATNLGLDRLPRQVLAVVTRLRTGDDAEERSVAMRLLEIGFLPGEQVRVIAHGPGRDPLAVRVGHTTFALRRHEAALIEVQATGLAPAQASPKGRQ
jgi:ferrous iron transport protein A